MKTIHPSLTNDVLLAWYADDFTGAAAVMEVLEFSGIPSMLFLQPPTSDQLKRYPKLRAVGVASTARTKSPQWMDEHLPSIFKQLHELDPALIHYKICTTLDSSPEIGSIGRVIEIGSDLFHPQMVSVLVAAPQMGRYQYFGHLFARSGDKTYRLDRHPVMSRHPVTPMTESDVAIHIGNQSKRLDIDYVPLNFSAQNQQFQPPRAGKIKTLTFDCTDEISESLIGEFIWAKRHENPFIVGSQGVEYALVQHWRDTGALPTAEPHLGIGKAKNIVAISGSVSPTTAEQIAWSKDNGFASISFDATSVFRGQTAIDTEIEHCINCAFDALSNNLDPLIHTAEGPDDPAVGKFRTALAESSLGMSQASEIIGQSLGIILQRILSQSGIRRAIVSGGDTSGYATHQLGIFALSALAPTIAGAAICKAHAEGEMDGLELALKGGQMGSKDYFGWIRDGGGAR
ncbi:four-carbon acid sugar kinase family protein [Paramylibacter ulvae]|nr:four-carbon acid sugar kinase family protein [Amylibacter ulvae]